MDGYRSDTEYTSNLAVKLTLCSSRPKVLRYAAAVKNTYHSFKLRSKIRSDFDAYMVFYETGFSELFCKHFRVEEKSNSFTQRS